MSSSELLQSSVVVDLGLPAAAWLTYATRSAPQPRFLMLIFAGWVNRSQQDVIEHLQEENQELIAKKYDG